MSARNFRDLLVKIWGQKGQYTEKVQLAPGYHGGDFTIDKVHQHKIDEWNNHACAWTIIGIVEGTEDSGMHVLPIVDGWVYSIQGEKLRPASA